VSWAEDAVRKSVSVTEKEALALKIIDLIADDLPALLKKLDGRKVQMGQASAVLQTKDVEVLEFEIGWRLELLKALSDPNIAYLLMTLGTIGLLAELYNPGAILPGIVGAISLILGFYSLQSLPINYAGVLLLLLGIVLFVLEATVTSYGLLAIGGILSMLLGSLMLIKTDAPFLQISWAVIVPVIGFAALVTFAMVGMGMRAMRRRPVTGSEGMIGLVGMAKTALAPKGQVAVRGELWEAMSDEPVEAGVMVEVTAIEGLTLRVKSTPEKGALR
jgi:membrane-bound serine protease (ClpP class)